MSIILKLRFAIKAYTFTCDKERGNVAFMKRKNSTGNMMMDYMSRALLLLMRSTPYERITIGNITCKAGVNRSTYYRHFDTKESIIRFYYDSIMRECSAAFRQTNSMDFRLYIKTRFETLYAHKEDLLNLHRAGLSHLLLDVLMKRFRFDELEKHSTTDELFKTSYHLGGLYNNMLLWFSHGMAESPEQMTDIAMRYRTEESMRLRAMRISEV